MNQRRQQQQFDPIIVETPEFFREHWQEQLTQFRTTVELMFAETNWKAERLEEDFYDRK